MGRQGNLMSRQPIFLAAKSLATQVVIVMQNFPKAYKYTFGEALQRSAVRVMRDIGAAMYHTDPLDRLRAVEDFQADFEELKGLLDISFERGWLTVKQYASFAPSVESIGRQSSAWGRKLRERVGQSRQDNGSQQAGQGGRPRPTWNGR